MRAAPRTEATGSGADIDRAFVDDISSLPLNHNPVTFSRNEAVAAALCRLEDEDRCNRLALIPVATAEPAFQVVPVESVSEFRWVPGTLTLLLLSMKGGHLSLVDADASRPAVLRSATLVESQRDQVTLAVAPSGTVAFVLSGMWPAAAMRVTLALYNSQTLERLSVTYWQLRAADARHSTARGLAVQCSQQSVVACFASTGTRVWSLSGRELGPVLFWAEALDQAAVSSDGHFLAGIRASHHEVLDGFTGACLFRLPMLVPDAGPTATARSISWAGPDSSSLHACYTCCKLDKRYEEPEDTVLLYMLLHF